MAIQLRALVTLQTRLDDYSTRARLDGNPQLADDLECASAALEIAMQDNYPETN